ncbi:ABC transporter permease [Streptomyces sp. NPDC101194]|uniref:ABC transporter permease n=1 Tax=Streptomyces sp. NPDC101194 TaxID=3366127 RepID=UPI0037F524EB
MSDVTYDSRAGATGAAPSAARSRGGARTVYLWELEKLTAQWRIRAVLVLCLVGPFLFALGLRAQDTLPSDTLFGRWAHDSGFAVPLVVLGFAGQWALPLLVCLVAGDIFSSEDHHGTWKTILTRSRTRGQVFAGKALAAITYSAVVVLLLGAGSLAAGVLVIGHQPLVGLSGQEIGAGRAAGIVVESWLYMLLPCLAFTALGVFFSLATRHSAAGIGAPAVLGLLLQLASLVDGLGPVRRLLPTTAFDAWHGLTTAPAFHRPLVTGAYVGAGWAVVLLAAGHLLMQRRDFTKG